MTAPATEKAAPIPADVLALRDRLLAEHERLLHALALRKGVHVLHDGDIEKLATLVLDAAILTDRASQEERIREDERGLRGKVVYPCASFRNEDEFRDPDGYVIVKAERAEASEGRPSPMYYTLVSDTGDVRTLLSTLFTRDPARARLRGDAS